MGPPPAVASRLAGMGWSSPLPSAAAPPERRPGGRNAASSGVHPAAGRMLTHPGARSRKTRRTEGARERGRQRYGSQKHHVEHKRAVSRKTTLCFHEIKTQKPPASRAEEESSEGRGLVTLNVFFQSICVPLGYFLIRQPLLPTFIHIYLYFLLLTLEKTYYFVFLFAFLI